MVAAQISGHAKDSVPSGRRHPIVSILYRLLLGLLSFAVLGSPLWLGLLVFIIVRHYAPSVAGQSGKVVGFGLLIVIPVYMMGHALLKSIQTAETASAEVVRPPVGEPSDFENAVLEPWKTAIDVQQHFNDLELRIRNFAVTLLVAILGATAFALKEHYQISFAGGTFSLSVAVLGAGTLGWLAFYFMDRFWYHQFLVAAVKHTLSIEDKYAHNHPELGLSFAIGKGSPTRVGSLNIHSSEKIDLFYAAGLTFLVLLMVVLFAISAPDAPKIVTAPTGVSVSGQVNGKSADAVSGADPMQRQADAAGQIIGGDDAVKPQPQHGTTKQAKNGGKY